MEKDLLAGRFEWVDGLLIRAVEAGHWLLIDNANFCNPTVLDRLNSLLEPNGRLLVNERGLVQGQVKSIAPHPNFRVFLTMDPQNGEISRAMRNRGIEISLVAPKVLSRDTMILLNTLGIPGCSLPSTMMLFHTALEEVRPPPGPFCHLLSCSPQHPQRITRRNNVEITLRHILHWGSLTTEQLQRGVPLPQALSGMYIPSPSGISLVMGALISFFLYVLFSEAMQVVYLATLRDGENRMLVQQVYEDHFGPFFGRLLRGEMNVLDFSRTEPNATLVEGVSAWRDYPFGLQCYYTDSLLATINRHETYSSL